MTITTDEAGGKDTSEEPLVFSTPHAKLYQRDCRYILRRHIAPDSIDMVMTSPPYYGLRDYQTMPALWDGNSDCQHEFQTRNYLQHIQAAATPKSLPNIASRLLPYQIKRCQTSFVPSAGAHGVASFWPRHFLPPAAAYIQPYI
jgi:hypothetical protein